MEKSKKSRPAPRSDLQHLREQVRELKRAKHELERAQALLQQTEEAERRSAEHLIALVEITNELSTAETVDDLCRRAVELGRVRLSFDRLGVWFRTEEPDVIVGSFGVDATGRIRDERNKRAKLDLDRPDGRIILGNEPFAVVGESPLLDARGETVGRATEMFAALWDGEKVIGHVSADNRVRHRPLLQQQCELLRLFGTVLGYLYTRKRVETERRGLIDQLQDALGRIKTLRGLIPICAKCKKIRDDKGYWNQIEVYIHEHSEADFSHGLCPDCAQELLDEIQRRKESKHR